MLPLHSPKIDKIEVVRKGKVRRAKLYYLRDRVGKAAKVKEKLQRKTSVKEADTKVANETVEVESRTQEER